jgi:hypothetical protein
MFSEPAIEPYGIVFAEQIVTQGSGDLRRTGGWIIHLISQLIKMRSMKFMHPTFGIVAKAFEL